MISKNEIHSVGVISSQKISNWIDIEQEVIKILGVENVKYMSYIDVDKKNSSLLHHFSEKDYNWRGGITNPEFKKFLDEPFDLLIGYFNKKNLFIENAVLQSNATFKVGISKVNQSLYDMEIGEIPGNIDNFLLELKKYLIILKKIKN